MNCFIFSDIQEELKYFIKLGANHIIHEPHKVSWFIGKDYYEIYTYPETLGRLYYKNSQMHRENGPARETPEGNKFWFYHSKYIDCQSQEEFERILKLKAFL